MPGKARRILVADKFPEAGIAELKALNLDVDYQPDLGADGLAKALGDAEILIVRSTKVGAAAIDAGKELQVIVRAGAGTDTIDTDKASALGIYVANCPGKNAAAVAELAMALLLAADRRVPMATAELRGGKWNKKEYSKADGLYGRTLGVLGVGRIGELVIERARAFGMNVLACSRSMTPERAAKLGAGYCPDLYKLARESDAVSVHLALSDETRHMVDARFLAEMKPRAILINTSRGEVVDCAALAQASKERGIRFALDVYEGEPGSAAGAFESELRALPGFIGTPHIGASTEQAQQAIADEAVRVVAEFLRTGHVENCVNLAEHTPAKWMLVVRHLDKVGVLAGVFDELRSGGINVQRTNNIVFTGAAAAVARIELDTEPPPALLATIRKQQHVLGAEAVPLED
ncbi:MAG: NAD(P)-binding domain-containing protein [Planctomycetes bacterium]|nr:NAD(P)-binding domain-containing protein [Planctomycetota bacterium]